MFTATLISPTKPKKMQTFTFKSDISEDSTEKKITLVFTGNLTLQNAEEIKNTLEGQKGDFNHVELTAREVSGIDVSFLQILESYCNTHQAKGRNVRILMDLPYDLKTLLANAGIAYPLK